MNEARRDIPIHLRVISIAEMVVALVSALLCIAFLPDGNRLGGDGIGEGFRLSFVAMFAIVALLFGYGSIMARRAASTWWWPPVVAAVAAPIVFVLLTR